MHPVLVLSGWYLILHKDLEDSSMHPAMQCKLRGVRHASLQVGDVEIVDRWVVTGVSQPILATGKLLRPRLEDHRSRQSWWTRACQPR